MKSNNKWQFWSITQCPLYEQVFTMLAASCCIPSPRDKNLNLLPPEKPYFSPTLLTSSSGSAPGDKMKIIGLILTDYL